MVRMIYRVRSGLLRLHPVEIQHKRSLIESSGADQGAVEGALDDLGNGRVPGIPALGCHGNNETFEFRGEGVGVALEASSPDAVGDLGRGPS